jgi:hypothetical protein
MGAYAVREPEQAAPAPIGGGGGATPSLSYSFDCSSGLLAVNATANGGPAKGLTIKLMDRHEIGFTPAVTDEDGIALFNITHGAEYALDSAPKEGYYEAYLSPLDLNLCLPPANITPPEQNITQPPENITPGQANITLPEQNASAVQNVTGQNAALGQNGTAQAQNITSPAANATMPPANLTQGATGEEALYLISEAEREVDYAKMRGDYTAEAERLISLAKYSVDKGNFELAAELARQAGKSIRPASAAEPPGGTEVPVAIPTPQPPPYQELCCLSSAIMALAAAAALLLYGRKKGKKLAAEGPVFSGGHPDFESAVSRAEPP